ncbi:DNA helicase [Tanacetum coccineum]
MLMMKEKKPLIDLNAEYSLEITEDVEVENITESQTPDKFDIAHIETGNMNKSEHVDQKMGGNYSYVGYRPMFSKVVGSEYGLRHPFAGHGSSTLFNTGYTGSLEPAFTCYFPRTKLILDFENSAIRLPTVNDDGGGSFFGSDICDNQIVMDFEHSRVYTLSTKGGVTNIASPFTHPKGYTLAFDGELYAAHSVCDRNQQKNYFSVPKGESSFKLTDRENEHPQFRLAKEQSSSVKGVSSMYVDIGDCEWSCNHCGARFCYMSIIASMVCYSEVGASSNSVYDAIHKGDHVGSDIGGRLILPKSFTDRPHYMYSHYLDALAICRVLGNPQFFITFTCNVKWPEIKRHMEDFPEITTADRADIVVRVFEQKVHDFCNFLQDSNRFGDVTGFLYTIEFQKRGLPHCHVLLWVKNKIQRAKEVDQYISAELPDPETDPEGYKVVSEMMVHEDQQALIFIYGHGGTGKTFLWKVLISSLRSKGKIVLAVALSGIASLLLPAGRTSHLRFKLPLDLTDDSICNIKKNTHAGVLLAKTSLIIWDESPMNDRRCFEMIDRTLIDIIDVPDKVFGGKSDVLGGDFRQTLPVKKGGSKAEVIAASIAESHLWKHFKETTKLEHQNLTKESVSWITIPEQYCIQDTHNAMSNLINFIYDEQALRKPNGRDLQQKAIVCPRNSTADLINSNILSTVEGTSTIYKSSDEAIPIGNDGGEVEMLYLREYLNTLQLSGFPSHELELKVGAPIMLLRNVNLHGGLCNDTMTQNCISDLKPERITKSWKPKYIANGSFEIHQIQHQNITDYMGCLIRVADVKELRGANTNLKVLRKMDIKNLNGNVVELALWDDMAHNFKKNEYELMEKPVIIAVSSCKVSLYEGMLQLTATNATHYYLNLDIPHLEEFRSEYKAQHEENPPLEISKERCHDLEQEKLRNRFPLSTLMQQNPETYRVSRQQLHIKHLPAMEPSLASTQRVIGTMNPDVAVQQRYNFKAGIYDGTTTGEFTFFTPNADVLTGTDCTKLVNLYDTPSPRDFPSEILNLQGQRHIFQFHYNPSCEKGKVDFYFDDILDKPMQITCSSEPSTQLSDTPGSGLNTPELQTPQLPAKETVHDQPPTSPITPSDFTTGLESLGEKIHDETAQQGISSKKTSKRPLFQDEAEEQKKKPEYPTT